MCQTDSRARGLSIPSENVTHFKVGSKQERCPTFFSLLYAQMSDKLILYFREWCGYCVRVQDVISELGVDVEQRNIWENEEWENDLVSGQGSSTVPVLCRITAGGETHWIPESDAIIRYLIQNHNS